MTSDSLPEASADAVDGEEDLLAEEVGLSGESGERIAAGTSSPCTFSSVASRTLVATDVCSCNMARSSHEKPPGAKTWNRFPVTLQVWVLILDGSSEALRMSSTTLSQTQHLRTADCESFDPA